MKKGFYLCYDQDAYNFALNNYADDNTEIVFCEIDKDIDRVCQIIFENVDKRFYIFRCCRTGYLKMRLQNYLALSSDEFRGYHISYDDLKSSKTGKPNERYIRGKIIGDSIIPL